MTLPLVGARLKAEDVERYIRDMTRAEAANEKFIASINNAGASANRGLPNVAQTAQRQSASVVNSFDRAGRSATGFGTTVVRGVGVAVGALATLGAARGLANFASSAIETRVTFERELANVGALAQATQAEIDTLGAQAEQLGASTAFSATDVLGGQQFLALAGFEIPEIVEALPGLLSTAAAAQEDLATTSDIVSNALSGFNINASETGRVADVLIQGLTSSNTDLVQLGTALSFAAPNAAALGVSIEESTAAIGLLSNAGIQGSRAGTTLRGVFNRLAAPTAEASAELERLGINAFTAEGQLKALPDVVAEFERGLDGLNDQQRAESINTIVGTIAGTGFTALLSAGSEELRNFTEELENSGGVAERVADQQLDNLAGDITRVSSAYEGLQLAVTRAATPSLRSFLQNAVLPSITGTTAFFNALSDGQSVLDSFAVGIADIAPDTSALVGEFADLQQAITGVANVSVNLDGLFGLENVRAFRFDDLFTFEVGDIQGQIRGAFEQVDISIGDFLSFESVGDDFARLDIPGILQAEIDSAAGFVDINIADFINFTSEEAGSVLDGSLTTTTKLKVGDFIDFSSFDFGAELGTATKIKIGDLIDFTSATTDGVSQLDINNIITGTYDIATAFGTIAISDIITGSLDFGTGEGSVTLGDDLTFEFDLGALQTEVQNQLTSVQQAILGAPALTEGGIELAPATTGIVGQVQDALAAALAGDFPEIDLTSLDNITEVFGALSGSLATIDTALAGATGDGSQLSEFVNNFSTSLSDVATTIDSVDATSIGASFTGAIDSVLGIFTTLNTIDDLALGGIAGGLSDVTTSILNFATDFTAGLDAETLGTSAAESAKLFIGSFSAVLSEPNVPEITGAAAGLVAAIGSNIRTAFESADLSEVGAEFGSLTVTLIDQIAATLSDPAIAADLGTGFSDIIVGITQGLSDSIAGFSDEVKETDSQLVPAFAGFTSNLVSALATGLEEADYGSIVAALVTGIANALQGALTQIGLPVPDESDLFFGGALIAQDAAIPQDRLQQEGLDRSVIGGTTIGTGAIDVSDIEGFEARRNQQRDDFFNFFSQDIPEFFGFGGAEPPTGGQTLENVAPPVGVVPDVTPLSDEAQELEGNATSAAAGVAELNSQLQQTLQFAAVPVGVGPEPQTGGQTLTNVAVPVQFQQPTVAPQTLRDAAVPVQFQGLVESAEALNSASASATQNVSGLVEQLNSVPAVDPNAPEARRTGLGDETGFDEAAVTSSINEQIASQLNFGDLPETVSSTITGAIESAIPPTPVIDSQAVNTAVLTAAQEAIPASEIPEFPSWNEVVGFNPPRLPRFPGWKTALGFEPPPIPEFPGWGSFIEFDIPSIPSFPPWSTLVGGVDIGSLIPPFPGWPALIGSGGGGGDASAASVDGFQTGTESAPNTGVALVGEQGPELRLINQGDRIFPAGVTSRILDVARSIASGLPTINSDPSSMLRGGGNTVIAPSTAVANVTISASGGGDASIDTTALGLSIAQGFGEVFAIPSFVGWDQVFSVSPVEIPPFPGWNELVGELENVNLIIQQTENITEVTIEEKEKEIGVGPIEPIPIEDLATFAAASTDALGSPSAPSANASIMPSQMMNMVEQSNTVVNNTTQNFNLTTHSLRSAEDVESDFAMMERLANV